MKTVTNNFKEEIRKLGREIDFKIFLYANDKLITQNNNFIMTQDNLNLVVEQFNQEEIEYTINADEIYNVSVVNRGELLSTMMKEVDFEVSKELKIGDVISCEFGLKVGNSYEYVDYGKYMIYEKDFNEDTKTYSYVAYDRMLLTMREIPNPSNFENKNILSVIQEICTITNLEFNGTSQTALTYPNLNKVINQGTFTDLVMTYRDMLDMICQALGLSMIVEDNELVLKDINEKEKILVGKNSLYLEDAMEGNVLSYSVDGASEQDGTPTPSSPQEVETIPSTVNLCGIPDQTFTHCGVTVTIKDGEITLNGTTTSTGTKHISPIKTTTLNGDYVTNYIYVSGSKSGSGTSGNFNIRNASGGTIISGTQLGLMSSNSKAHFTISSDTSIVFGIYIQTTGITFNNLKFKPQLVKGVKENYNYVPYGYWSRVKVTGKNLLNYETSVNGSIPTNSTSETLNSDSHAITSVWIPCKPNTTYTISGEKNRNRWQTKASDGTISYFASDSATITTNSTAKYLRCYYYYASSSIDPQSIQNVQIEESTEPTTYEPYKEKEVLIDMSKENLFDKDNADILNAALNASSGDLTANDDFRTLYINCSPNTTYTVSKEAGARFAISESNSDSVSLPMTTTVLKANNTGSLLVVTTGANAKKLFVMYYRSGTDTKTEQEIRNSIRIFEGTSPIPYYELCSNKDKTIKDRLLVNTNGNCSITKYIGGITLNGSESWVNDGQRYFTEIIKGTVVTPADNNTKADAMSTIGILTANQTLANSGYSGIAIHPNGRIYSTNDVRGNLATNNVELNYLYITPETITLPNTKIPLFEGINHITLIDDLETDTSVVYNSSDLAVEEIDETYLNDTNVSFRKKYGPINSVVLSRSEDYDPIYRKDDESIEKNGLCEYKIKDNPILLYNDREEYIDEIFNQLKGIEYYPNDYLSKGITFLDWLDFYNVKIGDNIYKCLMLNDEIKVEQGLEESVYSEIPEETVTDYKTSSKTDKEVSFIVDKQNAKIKGAVKQDDIIASLNVAIEDGQGIVELKGNSVIIESDNFTLNEEGNMTCNNADIKGGLINLFSGTKDNPTFKIVKDDDKQAKMTSSYFELNDSGLIQLATHYNNINNNSQLIISNGIDNIYEGRTNFFGINCRNDVGYDSLNFSRQDNQNNDSYQKSYEIRLDENEIREKMDLYNTQGTIDSYIMQRTYRENNEDKSLIRLHNTTADTYIYSTGIITPTVTQTSLESEKKDFEKLNSGLDIIKNIDIYKYHLKSQKEDDKKHIGFVIGNDFKYSQEITSNDNDGVDIYSFVSVCCKAIQEQQEQINSLKEEIKQLKEENK